jgi:hypothetical protein
MPNVTRDDTKYDYYNLRANNDGSVDVLGFGVYPDGSVLAGQSMKVFLDTFDSAEEAQAIYPEAVNYWSKWSGAVNSFNHLPGPDDNVPGGALPDDIGDDEPDCYPNEW